MKEQLFADYETSKMVRDLGFKETCFKMYHHGEFLDSYSDTLIDGFKDTQPTFRCPLWSQIKQWLWEKQHRVRIAVMRESGTYFVAVFKEGMHLCSIDTSFDSPITAETEGIKKAVEYLYTKFKSQP